MQPVIKWSGSKRSQAQNIVSYIPDKKYETYYEPFCGGCAILAYILENENIANKFNSFTYFTYRNSFEIKSLTS